MTIPSTTQTVIANTAIKYCMGHEVHVKKCSSREDVREASANILAEYDQKMDISSASTHMVEKKEKRKLLGKKKVYDLFIKFFHNNNVVACNKFHLKEVASKTVENTDGNDTTIDKTVDVTEDFFDALENQN